MSQAWEAVKGPMATYDCSVVRVVACSIGAPHAYRVWPHRTNWEAATAETYFNVFWSA